MSDSDSLKDQPFPSPEQFVTETPLYAVKESSDSEPIIRLEFFNGTVDTYCVGCERESVFQRQYTPPLALFDAEAKPRRNYSADDLVRRPIKRFQLEWEDVTFTKPTVYPYSIYLALDRLVPMEFMCTRNPNHHMYVFFRVGADYAVKIGQLPSLADIQKPGTKDYRAVLGDRYSEFTRSIGLAAHGVGVGSFVYLRRIFEDWVEEAHQNAMQDAGWDEEAYQRTGRMLEKVELIKDHLPEILAQNKNVYTILSKGIHELSEEECLEYYPAAKGVIELVLDERVEQEERKHKIEAVTNTIAGITGQVKKKD